MFPNVRLMIVAMFASIFAISCGLGVFAAFRLNHEPFARLASGSPPLQLASDNAATARATEAAAASFGDRFRLATPRSNATAPTPAQRVQNPDAGQTTKKSGAADVAVGTSADPPAADQAMRDAKTALAATPPATEKSGPTNVRKVSNRQRLAAKTQRSRRVRARAVAQTNDQNSASSQPSFQSAPDALQSQPVKRRRSARDSAVYWTSR
jgi:hypothetical protein